MLGHALWQAMPGERTRAVARARAALPAPEEQCPALVRRCVLTFATYLADAVRLERWSREDLRHAVRLVGLPHLRAALAAGRGVLILSAHVGNWELLAAALGDAGVPLSVVSRRPGDPVLAERLAALRARWGVESIWRDGGTRRVVRALSAGRAVGVLMDQATDLPGVRVPFFGRLAHTPTGPAKLALRMGMPVVPVHMCDAPNGRYVGMVEPPLTWDARGDAAGAEELTAAWTRHIEGWVRQAPHTWVWMHDRWRAGACRPAR